MARKVLSQKQRNFIQEYISNGQNGTQAAMVAYGTSNPNSAHVIAAENIRKATIRDQILGLIEKHSIGPPKWVATLSDAMNAESKQAIGNGEVISNPDFAIRLKAVDLCAKLADAYPHTDASRHEHRHLHLSVSEDPAILRFKVLHGRAPTERELADLTVNNSISTPNPIDVTPIKGSNDH